MPSINDFKAMDLRIGTVVDAKTFEEAKKPALKLWIDFGELGTKQSSAQITKRYLPEDIIGHQVVAVTGFEPLRIAGFKSEVLVIGGVPVEDDVVLLKPDENVPNGTHVL